MVTPGKDVTLMAINGGKGIKSKLYSMGLTPGITLRVLNDGTPGPFLVAVRDCKLALGYGVAKKIIVR
jgi:ferrous iron transport protein A